MSFTTNTNLIVKEEFEMTTSSIKQFILEELDQQSFLFKVRVHIHEQMVILIRHCLC